VVLENRGLAARRLEIKPLQLADHAMQRAVADDRQGGQLARAMLKEGGTRLGRRAAPE
jgi:hypothetical protein